MDTTGGHSRRQGSRGQLARLFSLHREEEGLFPLPSLTRNLIRIELHGKKAEVSALNFMGFLRDADVSVHIFPDLGSG